MTFFNNNLMTFFITVIIMSHCILNMFPLFLQNLLCTLRTLVTWGGRDHCTLTWGLCQVTVNWWQAPPPQNMACVGHECHLNSFISSIGGLMDILKKLPAACKVAYWWISNRQQRFLKHMRTAADGVCSVLLLKMDNTAGQGLEHA